MVILQACRIPEVRVFPPDSAEGNVINNERTVSNSNVHKRRHATNWRFDEMVDSKSKRLATAASNDDQHWGDWNPFHMRPANLTAFSSCQNIFRNSFRTHNIAIQRAKNGWVSSAAKSLDLVRQNLQHHLNKEISEVIKQYTDKFFVPAMENIRRNIGDNSASEEHLHAVCRQILEEAKRMYTGNFARGNTPFGDNSDSETGSHGEMRVSHYRHSAQKKRKESDTDSEASHHAITARKKGRPPLALSNLSGRVTPSKQGKVAGIVKKEGPKWDSSRITSESLFIMGAKANKALGFGATRGRLYIKHPDVFKYCGDSEDKQWLYENNRMPATGGKAYMLILDDIKDLVESEEYRNSPGLVLDALIGFKVPEHMQEKIRSSMNSQRTDINLKKVRGRPPNSSVENVPQTLNIPEQQPFVIKTEFIKTEEEILPLPSKSSQFELPGSSLIFDEVDHSPNPPSFLLSSVNEVDSSSDHGNVEVDRPLSTTFEISNAS